MNHEKTNPDAARETTGAEIDKSELEIDAVITVGVWLGAAADDAPTFSKCTVPSFMIYPLVSLRMRNRTLLFRSDVFSCQPSRTTDFRSSCRTIRQRFAGGHSRAGILPRSRQPALCDS